MKSKLSTAALFALTTLTTPVMADNGLYLGTLLSTVRVANDSIKLPPSNVSNLGVQAGYSFSEHFALEGRYFYAIERVSTLPLHQSQLYARVSYPFGECFSVYALAGVNISRQHSASSNVQSSFSGGAGVSYAFSEKVKGSLEYVSLAQRRLYSGNAVNIGLSYHF
ncbi:porin family protein [Vibrio hangzhouensis]|uniref:Outer membrane protein beta-barrel domain-containing protein n=1 Tax=Vibrio hangzhouensis TaxID=462991 RepID=A0A1H5XM96_9VIBR|nr:porin family protein [Vibrio hangzhouensis]SEG12851.1 Outer membrane protein beta-barrel domain-containing protein [Vibrio hangzhouensis]